MGVEHLGTRLAGNCWLPMVLCIHMLIDSSLRREGTGAGFTFKDWCPVIKRIHVLLAAILSPKLSRAGLTFKDWCSVIKRIHVLLAAMFSPKLSRAGFTFHPMVIFVHVSVAVLEVAELEVTGATFVHLDLKTWSDEEMWITKTE